MSVCKKPEGRQAASQAGIVRDHMLPYIFSSRLSRDLPRGRQENSLLSACAR